MLPVDSQTGEALAGPKRSSSCQQRHLQSFRIVRAVLVRISSEAFPWNSCIHARPGRNVGSCRTQDGLVGG